MKSRKGKHHQWHGDARKECEDLLNRIAFKESFDEYACKHLDATASELRAFMGKMVDEKNRI